MVTAILPVHNIGGHPFWGTVTGQKHLKDFLQMVCAISVIDNIIVASEDKNVERLAERCGARVLSIGIPGSIEQPYTFMQTMALMHNCENACLNPEDDLLIADHRNLGLSPDKLKKAFAMYKENLDSGIISVAFCRDHPCQYKTFYLFTGCTIFHLKDQNQPNSALDQSVPVLRKKVESHCENITGIVIAVYLKSGTFDVEFNYQNDLGKALIAHVIPFFKKNPLYDEFRELYIPNPGHRIPFNMDLKRVDGLIITVLMMPASNSYDTVECFTPQNAGWELGGFSGNAIVDKRTRMQINGRQEFPPVYSYDGSFCLINSERSRSSEHFSLTPMIMFESCFVSDWVDYYCSYEGSRKNEHRERDDMPLLTPRSAFPLSQKNISGLSVYNGDNIHAS